MTAKVPVSQNGECFAKSEFEVDWERQEVRCPGGQISTDYQSDGPGRGGRFIFPAATGRACPLRSQCVKGRGPRSISIQAEEGLQQQARLHNQTEAGRKSLRERGVVEHRIARLVGLGIRKSRYFGRKKTCFQVVTAAVMANLSLVVGFCRRQAQQGARVAEKAAAELANCSFAPVLTLWDRYFAWARPVRV